jgi:hypothetical protein
VGYDPLRMDPLDGQAYVEATRAALSAEEYAAAREEGRSLDLAGACALVHGLVAATPR